LWQRHTNTAVCEEAVRSVHIVARAQAKGSAAKFQT